MTTGQAIEYHITRNLLRRRDGQPEPNGSRLADRVISCVAVTAAMLLLGSYLQELLWVLLAAGAILTLGTRTR